MILILILLLVMIRLIMLVNLEQHNLVKQDDVGMTIVVGADTDIAHGDLLP